MEGRVPACSSLLFFVEVVALLLGFCTVVCAVTDPDDVQALQVLYTSLNSPSQLNGWNSSGGDSCGESWMGVGCEGSSVVSLQLSGLGLNGTLGYMLNNLASLRTLDLSNNRIHDTIPYQLPPNLSSINLSGNNFSGVLPYSISSLRSLNYMNISRNMLSQGIGDVFANHSALDILDASFNNFSGDLPTSFSTLTSLSTLQLQSNQFSGSLSTLIGLPLTNLNVANNNFSGEIPTELLSLPNFLYIGNTFSNGPASPVPYAPPHPESHHNAQPSVPFSNVPSNSHHMKNNPMAAGSIVGLVLGSLFFVVLLLLVLHFVNSGGNRRGIDAQSSNENLAVYSIDKVNAEMQELRPKATVVISDIQPPVFNKDVMVDSLNGKSGSLRRVKSPTTSTQYTVATLQIATNSFSQENLVGEGSLGRVYRGVFPNGKVMAIKKIDSTAASLQDEDNFLEVISNMSRLRHPNILALVGYCAEHGQRLLIHEFMSNGSLHDMLHLADDRSKLLTWNTRVRVALGAARALEYLHEVCLPFVVHRNLKSANILLDEELTPHLSDSGPAVLAPNADRQVSSAQMVGSFGYSAPECALSGIYTVKSDVYSFGVVMLELLTGRKPLESSRVRSEQSLVRWATPQLHDIDALAKMVDPTLNGMYPAKSLSRFADIIALCVQTEPEFRPPMSEVVQALVRLMQRASMIRRRSSEEYRFAFRLQEHETGDL